MREYRVLLRSHYLIPKRLFEAGEVEERGGWCLSVKGKREVMSVNMVESGFWEVFFILVLTEDGARVLSPHPRIRGGGCVEGAAYFVIEASGILSQCYYSWGALVMGLL